MCITRAGNSIPVFYMLSKHESINELDLFFTKFIEWNSVSANIIMTYASLIYFNLIIINSSLMQSTFYVYGIFIELGEENYQSIIKKMN